MTFLSSFKFGQTPFKSSVAPGDTAAPIPKRQEKPLKYYVTDYFAQPTKFERGINWQNGSGIPRKDIDASSNLRVPKQTRLAINSGYELGTLPLPTTPSLRHGVVLDTSIEDSLRPQDNFHPKSSVQKDTHFYKRSFQIFDGLSVRPNGCVNNVVQKNAGYRQGIDTRHISSKDIKRK